MEILLKYYTKENKPVQLEVPTVEAAILTYRKARRSYKQKAFDGWYHFRNTWYRI